MTPFALLPRTATATRWPKAAVALLLVAALHFGYYFYATRNLTFEVSVEGLRISGDLYGRVVPRASLLVDRASIVNLNEEGDHAISWRTNGISMPGYSSGWFRLRNGEKALAFLRERDAVLYLPTSDGYALLLSAEDSRALLYKLKSSR